MKEPSNTLLRALAQALEEAEHQNIAGRMLAGLLWAVYPEWYDLNLRSKNALTQKP